MWSNEQAVSGFCWLDNPQHQFLQTPVFSVGLQVVFQKCSWASGCCHCSTGYHAIHCALHGLGALPHLQPAFLSLSSGYRQVQIAILRQLSWQLSSKLYTLWVSLVHYADTFFTWNDFFSRDSAVLSGDLPYQPLLTFSCQTCHLCLNSNLGTIFELFVFEAPYPSCKSLDVKRYQGL